MRGERILCDVEIGVGIRRKLSHVKVIEEAVPGIPKRLRWDERLGAGRILRALNEVEVATHEGGVRGEGAEGVCNLEIAGEVSPRNKVAINDDEGGAGIITA